MKKILLLLFLFFVASTAQAKTVDIKDYAVPDDGLCDTPGFQTAVDALRVNGGGTLLVSGGTWELSCGDAIRLVDYGNYVSYSIVGAKGSIIRVTAGAGFYGFYAGNVNQLEVRDLTFVGGTPGVDVQSLLLAAYTDHVIISDCRFYGVYAASALIHTMNVNTVIEKTQFGGSAAGKAVILAAGDVNTPFGTLTVKDTNFIDYANFLNQYLSKTHHGIPAWIRAEQVSTYPSRVVLERLFFDEGAYLIADIRNVKHVEVNNIASNVNGTTPGGGIRFDNVANGNVVSSRFGYTTNRRPALVLVNNSHVQISRLEFEAGVYAGTVDATSKFYPIGICRGCPSLSRTR